MRKASPQGSVRGATLGAHGRHGRHELSSKYAPPFRQLHTQAVFKSSWASLRHWNSLCSTHDERLWPLLRILCRFRLPRSLCWPRLQAPPAGPTTCMHLRRPATTQTARGWQVVADMLRWRCLGLCSDSLRLGLLRFGCEKHRPKARGGKRKLF